MEHYNNQLDGQEKESSKLSAVASNPKKNIILVVAMIICGALVIYNFVWKSSKTKNEIKPEVSQKIATEETPKIENVTSAPAPVLPDPPEITIPDTPAAPAAPSDPTAIPTPIVEEPQTIVPTNNNIPAIIDAPNKNNASLNERRRSSIMKTGGRGGGGGDSGTDKDGGKGDNGKSSANDGDYTPTISSNFNPSKTGFTQQKITRIGDTRYIIAQGKVIEAVLESALNTDMPGPIRAIITRDVYSESGNYVLIPKGSRIIGSFLANNSPGAIRVAITWSRVIRPDGVDISVDSPAIDNLGKGGLVAEVDAKIADILASSMASAIIQIGTANAAQKLSGSGSNNSVTNSTTTSPTTGTTNITTGNPTALAIQNATNNLGANLQSIQQNYTNAKPALQVNQGTKVSIFVNKDIIFSRNYVYNRSKMLE